MSFGWPEILLLMVIVILLFGVGRIGKVATEMGQGIRNFRKAMDGEKDEADKKPADKKDE